MRLCRKNPRQPTLIASFYLCFTIAHQYLLSQGTKMRPLCILFLLALAATPASAQRDLAGSMGVGTTSCAQFGQAYTESPEIWEMIYFSWAQGYMAGLNMMFVNQGGTGIDLAAIDVDQQQHLIRKYCADNPLEDFQDAAMHLYFDVLEQHLNHTIGEKIQDLGSQ
jgi:hypothetical protein